MIKKTVFLFSTISYFNLQITGCNKCCRCCCNKDSNNDNDDNGNDKDNGDRPNNRISTIKNINLSVDITNITVSKNLFPFEKNNTGPLNTTLCSKSIFDDVNTLPDAVKNIITNLGNIDEIINILESDSENKYAQLESKRLSDKEINGLGCLLGMVIGDTLGSTYEFRDVNKELYNTANYRKYTKNALESEDRPNVRWTDDASI